MLFPFAKMSRDRIQDIQFKKIKKLVSIAYEKSEFYHKFYSEHGFDPTVLKDYSDISRIPVVERKLLKSTPVEQIVTNHDVKNLHMHTTSGSSGIPVKYYYNTNEAIQTQYGWLRAYLMMGMKVTDLTVALRDPIDIKKPASFQRLGIMPYDYYNIFDDIGGICARICEKYENIDILKGMPSDLLNLCYEIRSGKYKIPKVRMIVSDSEVLSDFARQYISETFGKPVFDSYGSVENGCIAFQLPGSEKYYLNEDQVLLESRDGDVKMGDAVITNLRGSTFPIIRYQIGDMIDFGNGKSERPDIKLRTIDRIHGKYLDFIVLPDKTIVSPHVPKQELTHLQGIRKFQIKQKDFDRIIVTIEREPEYSEETEKMIYSSLKKAFKNQVEINIDYDDDLTKKCSEKGKKFRVIESDIAQEFLSSSNKV